MAGAQDTANGREANGRPSAARLLATLERLLTIEAVELAPALDQARHLVAEPLGADKVDAAFHDPAEDSLVAAGTSHTPTRLCGRW